MGKNNNSSKRKRSLDLSVSSADVSLEKSVNEEEKLTAKRAHGKPIENPNKDGVISTAVAILSGPTMNAAENKSETEYIEEITESGGKNVVSGDSGTLFTSSEDLRSTHSQDFESYFETLTKRRSQSLDRRPDHFSSTMEYQKENFAVVRCPTTSKTGSFKQPRKKVKAGIYTTIDYNSFHPNANKSVDICPRAADKIACTDKCIGLQSCCSEKSDSVNDHVHSDNNVNSQILGNVSVHDNANTVVAKQNDVSVSDTPISIETSMTADHVHSDNNVNSQILGNVSVHDNANTVVAKQNDVSVSDTPIPIAETSKQTVARSRPQMNEEQRKQMKDVQLRTIFIEGHHDDLRKYYRNSPRSLNKELIDKARGEVEKVFLTKQGGLKIIAKNQTQKDRLLKITEINDKPVEVSIPYSLKHQSLSSRSPPVQRQANDYFVKGVVYGLLEDEQNLNEIAIENGAHHMCRIGNSEHSKSTLIAFTKDTVLPPYLEVNGRKFKIFPFVPKPLRCFRCNIFGHSSNFCRRNVVCSSCAGGHFVTDCPDKSKLKCINCGQGHSAAYTKCPVYIKTQAALKIRSEQHVTLAEAVVKVDEIKTQRVNKNVLVSKSATYASRVKVGIENQAEVVNNVMYAQEPAVITNVNSDDVNLNGDLVKEFLAFDTNVYKAINTCRSDDVVSDFDSITQFKISFVLGVLATVDKAASTKDAQFVIGRVASHMLFNNKIELLY